jgi:pyrimidine-specific ribonucleoside hydrolase
LPSIPICRDFCGRSCLWAGAAKGGNVTPAAEFNVWEDPDAAKLVFAAGAPIGMCGLDVTEKAILRPGDWEELAASGKPAGLFVRESLQTAWAAAKQWGEEGVAMHDACPVLYLAHPELFKAKKAGVRVETRAALTLGKTVTDLWSDQKFESQNALVVLDVDRDAFIKILKNCILRI